jgi:hypothetical protein
MEFIEAPAFTRHIKEYLDDDQYLDLQSWLLDRPRDGDLMERTGGFRKLRWPDARRGKGKRGGLRLIYYLFEEAQQIWLMTIYGKDEMDDLNDAEKDYLRDAIARELAARRTRRWRGER